MIRPATPADEPAVRACAEAAYSPYVGVIGRKPAPMVADFAALIREGVVVHVAAGAGGRVEGYIVCYPLGDAMRLENVAVLPAAAGRGLGKALVGRCEAAARAAGLAAVELYTNAAMVANLSIYPHLGYRETGRRHEHGFDRSTSARIWAARARATARPAKAAGDAAASTPTGPPGRPRSTGSEKWGILLPRTQAADFAAGFLAESGSLRGRNP